MDLLPDELTTKVVGGAGLLTVLVSWAWKRIMDMRADRRTDAAGQISQNGYAQIVKQLREEAGRQESVITNLSARLTALDDRLNVEMDARRKAVHDALDAAQATLAMQHRLETVENANDALRTHVIALEQEVRTLKLTRPMAGDMP